jgi:translation initiation factor IF-2
LDLIVLAAEMEGLSYDPKAPGQGVIIESKMDSRRGLTAMAIVRNGTLRIGDKIHTPTASGKVKILENFMGQGAEELSPSSPALILGFNNLPQVGEEFTAGLQIDTNLPQISQISVPTTLPICEIGAQISDNSRVIKVFLKADVAGSLEVLSEIIKAIPEAKIVEEALGNVSDGDVKNAGSLGAAIIGFKVKPTKAAENLAKSQDVKIINSEIIYELLKKLEEEIEILRKPLPQAELTILAVFSQRGKKQVIGGRVESGMIRVNSPVKIFRGENEVGSGKILNLQQAKKDTTQVGAAEECGILFESDILTAVGDRLIHEAPSRTS